MKLKKLFSLNKKAAIFILLLVSVSVIGQTFAAIFLASGLNQLMNKQLESFLSQMTFSVITWLIALLASYFSSIAKQKFIQDSALYLRMTALTNAYDEVTTQEGEIKKSKFINMATSDITVIESGINSIFSLIAAIIGALSSGLTLLFYHYSFLIATVIFAFFLLLIPLSMKNKLIYGSKKLSEQNEILIKDTTNLVTGIFDLFNYHAFSIIEKKNKNNSKKMKTVKIKFAKINSLMSLFIAFINIISQFFMVCLAGYLAFSGIVGFGVIVSVGNLSNQFFSSISNLSEIIATIVSAQAILDKFSDDHSDKTGKNTPSNNIVTFNTSILANNLIYDYSDKQIEYPDFEFKKNKKYLIQGESGSGKTTLINIISGNLKNYKGSLSIDDQEIANLDKNSLTDFMVVMSQQSFILNGTIKENICLGKSFDNVKFKQVLNDSHLKDYINSLPNGEETILDSNSLRLSGGQIQRIAIARALYHDKEIIIFDEGTANLDVKTATSIEKILLSNPNKTVVMISHSFKGQLENLIDKTYHIPKKILS